MDFLGVIEEITIDGKAIVRGSVTPNNNDPVFDQKMKRIGFVRRVFGPVDSPYVTVNPIDKTALVNAVGKKVYYEGDPQYGKGKRRN